MIADISDIFLPDGREWYYEQSIGSNTLLITVGDSWTWGDSLGRTTLEFDDREHRLTHVYGARLSGMLECDFINIGIPGGSNLYILNYLVCVLKNLKKTYDKRYIIFTLTESGRELKNSLLDQKKIYQALAGKDWPEFTQLIKGQYTKSSMDLMMSEISGIHFQDVVGLFLNLRGSVDLNDLLYRYENYTTQAIKKAVGDDLYLARNFTSYFPNNGIDIEYRWVDIISSRGRLIAYPKNLYVMSDIGMKPLIEFCGKCFNGFSREEWIKLIDTATEGVDWLDSSPYNGKKATKHPLEEAHLWWAEYLYSELLK